MSGCYVESMETAQTSTPRHPFAPIAPGPYRYLGMSTTEDREREQTDLKEAGEVHTTNLCGGSCAHCGTAIFNVHYFKGSNGHTFKIGSTCVTKALGRDGENGGEEGRSLVRKAKAEAAKRAKKIKLAREQSQISALDATLADETQSAILAALPHPQAWRAAKGETMLAWAQWYRDNAQHTGRVKAAKAVAKAVAR